MNVNTDFIFPAAPSSLRRRTRALPGLAAIVLASMLCGTGPAQAQEEKKKTYTETDRPDLTAVLQAKGTFEVINMPRWTFKEGAETSRVMGPIYELGPVLEVTAIFKKEANARAKSIGGGDRLTFRKVQEGHYTEGPNAGKWAYMFHVDKSTIAEGVKDRPAPDLSGIGIYTHQRITSVPVFLCAIQGFLEAEGPPASGDPARPGAAFTNSLGMKLVPVPDTGILMSTIETRVGDFRAYASENTTQDAFWKEKAQITNLGSNKTIRFNFANDHPVVRVSWFDARSFCAWLTLKEGRPYRLPTDHEWSCAVGIGDRENAGASPRSKNQEIEGVFPWGTAWPPPKGAGNYNDKAWANASGLNYGYLAYDDGFPSTAPVGSFTPNKLGIYDLGGNAGEFCEDWFDLGRQSDQKYRVTRGASWEGSGFWPGAREAHKQLWSSDRDLESPDEREPNCGFRVVTVK